MLVKTATLTGAALDWAVAKCEDLQPVFTTVVSAKGVSREPCKHPYYENFDFGFLPSTNWIQGGEIIDRERINFNQTPAAHLDFRATIFPKGEWNLPTGLQYGPTHLIAGMRCYVASRMGAEVEVPDNLDL